MNNAERLRRVQTALKLEVSEGEVSDEALLTYLDALVDERRGPPKTPRTQEPVRMTNNLVLKKLRIALDLKEPQMLQILAAGGQPLTPRQLTPLFRKHGSKHHRVCTDAVLMGFLDGLGSAEL